METAKEFCVRLDETYGEQWSDDYDELPSRIIEYAKYYCEELIISTIQKKLDDVEYDNREPRMSDEYYMKNDAKIEVLEDLIRLINDKMFFN